MRPACFFCHFAVSIALRLPIIYNVSANSLITGENYEEESSCRQAE
ncbi:hypothetical protein STSP2_02591 [Anaerohalosphaera lusitana]|uniref:Uncharacterized protein n=1 Tax=Anaerohalosphaera lusitana TaxID=1936003 RepID=A0A1U9NN75_9BACT|nr:hypothetical protein STSP2_02591 [Anaerohalosphaera lusitana]